MMQNSNNIAPQDNQTEYQSLRWFLQQLNKDQLLTFTVKREDYLLSAIVEELEKQGRFPVVQLVDPDNGQRTIANTFASRELLKGCIQNIVCVEEKAEAYPDLTIVTDAPVQEIIIDSHNLDLTSLPAYRHFEGDAGRYITSGIVIARDPKSGRYNFSFHRIQIKDKNRLGISLHSHGDLWRYFQSSAGMGQDLEIAVMIGAHPAYYITGASKIPQTQDDYSWAAAYMDAVPEVVKAKTVDILVPAFAEYVIEGRLLQNTFEKEGPFGEYTGYSTDRSTNNVFEVSCMTKRHDAVYQDLVPGFAWEHLLLSQFTKEVNLLHKLQKEIPEIKALNMPKNGCHFHAYLSMEPAARGQARQAMMLLFGLDLYLKLIIVVDSDIDVFNEEEVLWAVATHVQADQDVFIVSDTICNRLDPSSADGVSAKMGIDATKPIGKTEQRVTVPDRIKDTARKIMEERIVL